jgi:hypothetical protein
VDGDGTFWGGWGLQKGLQALQRGLVGLKVANRTEALLQRLQQPVGPEGQSAQQGKLLLDALA